MIDNFIQAGIISPQDIELLQKHARVENRRVVFVDSTFVLPNSNEDIFQNFIEAHLPEAVFFNIGSICDKSCDLPHMLPNAKEFAESVSKLGIHNNDILVLYGQHGMIMGPPRVWWMFKGFGHDSVIVLNGGLPSWVKAGFKTESGAPAVHPINTQYHADDFNKQRVITMDQLITSLESASAPIIDARPSSRFIGTTPEPRASMRSGHIPNSLNLPCSSLVNDAGQFKSKEALIQLFDNLGIRLSHDAPPHIITTCGSGITACALTLALHHLGYKKVSVYDGSWAEWGKDTSPTPVISAY